MIRPVPNGSFEDNPLVVALALPLGLDAVGTCRALLPALYAPFSTCEAAGFGPLPHLGTPSSLGW